MVRVGSLVDQMLLAKDIRENKTNMTPKEQLELSREMDGDVVETLCDYLEVSTVYR